MGNAAMGPDQVLDFIKQEKLIQANKIPDFVYNEFNKLIAKYYNKFHKSSTFSQKEVMDNIVDAGKSVSVNASDVYNSNWLDVEEKYREVGWKVVYERAAYYESDSYFTFSKKEE